MKCLSNGIVGSRGTVLLSVSILETTGAFYARCMRWRHGLLHSVGLEMVQSRPSTLLSHRPDAIIMRHSIVPEAIGSIKIRNIDLRSAYAEILLRHLLFQTEFCF